MLTASIPQALREAIQLEASDFKGSDLASAAQALSIAYRAGLPARLDSAVARAAYIVTRLPATSGALSASLRELPFQPESWLDLGAGPGTAAWLAECPITLVEQNPGWQNFVEARWIEADLRRLPASLEPHDLVTICYALNELSERDRQRLIAEAWTLAKRALLILEPGTKPGFEIVKAARTQLLAAGAHIQGPCPHPEACPVPAGDWCHFAVRVERTREHRIAKGGSLNYEDEKFSYILVLKDPVKPAEARVVRHPDTHPHLIELSLCTQSTGLQQARIKKRDKLNWKQARKADWGDPWETLSNA
ncbi:small ribosomal subunit Rsm22 family protein [Paludibaculum fermentans]|uniref:Methyltransferase type 11 n=1 Tax=Paludibaculum fermentans TaxID=1473598 RepID=A0A7S7NMQ5_PALFE|nr:small ribosomal subunit Rsm22 family protein [Paludibaculum fermentans]QOY86486.1 methyltransferase type 11 [Paludibaculum fermentans]